MKTLEVGLIILQQYSQIVHHSLNIIAFTLFLRGSG